MRTAHQIANDELERALKRIAELEAAVLAAKVLLEPPDADPEAAWKLLDETYHSK